MRKQGGKAMVFTQLVRPVRGALVIVAALSILFSSCSKKKEESKREGQGTPNVTIDNYGRIPDVTLKRLDGGTERLSLYREKIVILNLWATWNKDCVKQVTELNALQKELQRLPYVVIGVSIDKDGKTALGKFLETTPIGYPVFYNGEEVLKKLGSTRRLPVTYILLPDGVVYEKVVGFQDRRSFEEKIKEVLRQRL